MTGSCYLDIGPSAVNTKDRLLSYSLIRTPDSIVLCRGTRLKMQKIFDKQLEDSLLIPVGSSDIFSDQKSNISHGDMVPVHAITAGVP